VHYFGCSDQFWHVAGGVAQIQAGRAAGNLAPGHISLGDNNGADEATKRLLLICPPSVKYADVFFIFFFSKFISRGDFLGALCLNIIVSGNKYFSMLLL
jgi:hypothetical protein